MTTTINTRVGIAGAVPSGLMLSHLLTRSGIDSVAIDSRPRPEIETTHRAAILESMLQPRVEADMAFVMARDLGGPAETVADALTAVAGVLPVIEVVDSRIADWRITLVDTLADNASCGQARARRRPHRHRRTGCAAHGHAALPQRRADRQRRRAPRLRVPVRTAGTGRRGGRSAGQPSPLHFLAGEQAGRARLGAASRRHRPTGCLGSVTARFGDEAAA